MNGIQRPFFASLFALALLQSAALVGCKSAPEEPAEPAEQTPAAAEEPTVPTIACDTAVNTLEGEDGTEITVACPANCTNSSVWGVGVYSDDSSACVAAIHDGEITRAAGGEITLTIRPGQPSYTGGSANGVSTSSWGSWGRSFSFGDMPEAPAGNTIACSTAVNTMEGPAGTEIEITCPADCMSGSVWGTELYSDDSSACRAAIHAGALPLSGGTTTLTIRPGADAYAASIQNGVSTSSWGTWGRSFSFGEVDTSVISCTMAVNTLEGETGTKHTIVCPAGCDSGSVWGTDMYSDDSAACRAAIHAGVVTAAGGTATLTIQPGAESYAPSERNGVSTSRWGSWARSFNFLPEDN